MNPKKDEVFYDLGSGTGKPSMVAYLCFDFSKVIGIEITKDLCDASKKILNSLKINFLNYLSQEKRNCKIDFLCNDFNNCDFTDADVIFINS